MLKSVCSKNGKKQTGHKITVWEVLLVSRLDVINCCLLLEFTELFSVFLTDEPHVHHLIEWRVH